MLEFRLKIVAACLLSAAGGPMQAGDAAAGRDRAGPCLVCHGRDGVGTNPTVPNIGGQSEMYLVKALQDFRDGRRENEQMSIIAEGPSDEEIGDLAAWYASIETSFVVPE